MVYCLFTIWVLFGDWAKVLAVPGHLVHLISQHLGFLGQQIEVFNFTASHRAAL